MERHDLLAALFVASAVLTLPARAEACGCAGGLPLSVHVKGVTAVFVGTVEAVTGTMPQPIVATVLVDKTYRGRVDRRTVVSGSGNNCDIAFIEGETYLVYAQEHDGVLLTYECTRTRPVSAAAEDVRYLDNLAAEKPQALVFGDVFRAVAKPDGTVARQALFETLQVIAVNAERRRSVPTDRWGPYQLVLAPGDYELWVERQGQRVTTPTKVTLRAGEVLRVSFTADYH
jgi:hypothetical protein